MGYRAHFALRRAGQTTLFASHWGGYRLMRDLLHGPEIFGAYVRTRRPCEELFYGDSVDGVALLDCDRRALSFWGGYNLDIESAPGLRRHYLTLLRRRWTGWTIEWMPLGSHDFAARLGLPEPEPPSDDPTIPVILEDVPYPDDTTRCVLTIIDPDGPPRDLRSGWRPGELLSLGPSLLRAQACAVAAALPRESVPDRGDRDDDWSVSGGLILEPATRTIDCWWNVPSPRTASTLQCLERFWPAWSLQARTEGLPLHAHRSGRSTDGLALSRERAAPYLEQLLLADDAVDFPTLAREQFEQLVQGFGMGPGTEISYGVGIFSDDAGLPVPEALRGQIRALLDEL